MPTLADALCLSVKKSSGSGDDLSSFSSDWYVRFAYNLGVGIPKAQELVKEYGKGYIYSRGGYFVVPDVPQWRYKMVRDYGTCVIVDYNGDIRLRTSEDVGRLGRERAKRAYARERSQIERIEREYKEACDCMKIFNAGKGVPRRKREGKGKSNSCIGQYVSGGRAMSMADYDRIRCERVAEREVGFCVKVRINI